MPRRVLLTLLLVVVGGLVGLLNWRATTSAQVAPRAGLAVDLAAGQRDGLLIDRAGRLALLADAHAAPSEAPYTLAGLVVGAEQQLAEPTNRVTARWRGQTPPGSAIRLEVRGRAGQIYTPWVEVDAGTVTLDHPVEWLQYRLTLLASTIDQAPLLDSIDMQPERLQSPGAIIPPGGPYRIYATRIGLIGGRTSNGHIIEPQDRFVALPSRRVLASKGGTEYQVQVTYKGRSLVLPIWDTGPWNIRDTWWEIPVRREMWNDLPRGLPQSTAGYFELYNGGRDGFHRRITNPAGIDLSDGAFYELGMSQSDWIMVTPLWSITPP